MKKVQNTFEYTIFSFQEIQADYKKLVTKAQEMCLMAYAPYSNFKVGAAILLDNDKIVGGNNQENMAYPSGLCAERVALFSSSAQYPSSKIRAIAITSSHKDDIISPCGACRQVMSEIINRQKEDFDVIMACSSKIMIVKASDLLPLAFSL